MTSTRRHRLPQRLDYTLIPAPIDVSLPIVDEKSPLPAIIVTPSSPIGEKDFAIAFLAPPPKPTLLDRVAPQFRLVSDHLSFVAQHKSRAVLLLLLFLFVLSLHVITHRLATMHPHLSFDTHTQGIGRSASGSDAQRGGLFGGWFGVEGLWRGPTDGNLPPRFVIKRTD